MLTKVFHSFRYAWRGLITTWDEEHNFRLEVLATVVVGFCIVYFDFTIIESVFCVFAVTMVLCAEIINTTIEDLCNKVEPQYDPVIAKIKNTSGAFVLVAVLGALVIGAIVFYSHFLG